MNSTGTILAFTRESRSSIRKIRQIEIEEEEVHDEKVEESLSSATNSDSCEEEEVENAEALLLSKQQKQISIKGTVIKQTAKTDQHATRRQKHPHQTEN
ncbi:hypothetical protein QYF36_010655 [Acer negundo]|nr:hypothetical protein QYF36_010655 [Acer negundo]